MTLFPEERKSIVQYRLERASDTLQEAKDNAKLGHWNLVANRLYYTVFYAGSALLISRMLNTASHSGFVRMFHQHFIKTGEIENKYGRLLSELFRNRQSGDYDDIFDFKEEDIAPYFEQVEELLQIINNKLN